MRPRDIVVIGGSAGSIESLKTIVGHLPSDFHGSIFIVVHVSPDSPQLLARLLSHSGPLDATNPLDHEPIRRGHIYVARPDHHLTIEDGKVRVVRGPRENRHRPAIDPLLRTAAREWGSQVIGVILSGLLDDGSAGLYAVKQRGGIAIVQEPNEAIWKEMPRRAIEYAAPQYILPLREIAPVLVKLTTGQMSGVAMVNKNLARRKSNGGKAKRKSSSQIGLEKPDVNQNVAYVDEGEGVPSVFACPECHGVLWELKDGKVVRFRCRVGHSYGAESLASDLSSSAEAALWAAVRALEEKSALHRRMSEEKALDRVTTSRMLDQSASDLANAHLIRDMIFRGEAKLQPKPLESEKKFQGEPGKSEKSEKIA